MRKDIIHKLIKDHNYKTYLEIGVDVGQVFKTIQIDKVGVDPSEKTQSHCPEVLKMTSDQFFETNKKTFDLVFIDGLHHAYQVLKDIKNSLRVLNEGGTIVCHDMLPPNEPCQRVPRETQEWTGDCWKAWAYLRATDPNLEMFIHDTDYGVGIIRRGKQELIEAEKLDWDWFVKNRDKLNPKKCQPTH